jgi:hypothetical protein
VTSHEPSIAFAVGRHEDPAIEIRVNFGIFAGRDVTPAEIDRLAEWLLDEVPEVTIISEERHEIGGVVEAAVHLVRVEVTAENVPSGDHDRRALEQRLVERSDYWARTCIADRHGDTADL